MDGAHDHPSIRAHIDKLGEVIQHIAADAEKQIMALDKRVSALEQAPPVEPEPGPDPEPEPVPPTTGWLARGPREGDIVLTEDRTGNITLKPGQQIRSAVGHPRRRVNGFVIMADSSQVVGVESLGVRAVGITGGLIEDVASTKGFSGYMFTIRDSGVTINRCIACDSQPSGGGLYVTGDRSSVKIFESVLDSNGHGMGASLNFNPNAYIHGGIAKFADCLISNGGGQAIRPNGVIQCERNLFYLNPVAITLNRPNSYALHNIVLNADDRHPGARVGWGINADTTQHLLIEGNIVANRESSTTAPAFQLRVKTTLRGNAVFAHVSSAGHGYMLMGSPSVPYPGLDPTNTQTRDRLNHGVDVDALIVRERERPRGAWYGGIEAAMKQIRATAEVTKL